MAEFTDPTVTYIVLLLFAIGAGLGAGYFLAEHLVTMGIMLLILGLLGFGAGNYTKSTHSHWVMTLMFGVLVVAAMTYFVSAVTVTEALAAFLIGLYIGYRMERRGGHGH